MKNVLRAISVAVILTLALTACGGGGSEAPTPTTAAPIVVNTPVPADPGVPTVASSDACNNLYYPVKVNSFWTYSSTGGPTGPYNYTEKINEVRADGFSVVGAFRQKPKPQNWQCTPQGLVPTTLVANNVASIIGFRRIQEATLTNVTGVVLPNMITPGMTWAYEADFTGTQVEFGVSSPVSGHIKLTYTAGNTESVTVAAGTYDALPITIVADVDTIVQTSAGPNKINNKSTYTYWYAPNIGWVKASGSGKIGGADYLETIELVSYTVQ